MFLNHSVVLQLVFQKPYGIHSPFLFNLADQCIFSKEVSADFDFLEQKRKELRADLTEINVLDCGQGSKRFVRRSGSASSRYCRSVASIARNSLQTPAMCHLLWRLAQYFTPKTILEVGTSLGITTSYLARAAPEAKIITLEGCPQTASRAKVLFDECGATNVDLHIGLFECTLPKVLKQLVQVDMVYLDGDHGYQAVMQNFNTILDHIHQGSVLIVDDIRWSKGMKKAWRQMAAHPKVTLAVDLFKSGILFFNPGLSKEIVPVGFNFF